MLFKRKRKSSIIWIQIWRTNLNPALNDSALVLKCNRLNKNQLRKIFIGKVIQIAASWCEVWTQEFFAGWETEANSKNSRKTQSPIKNNNHEVTFYFRVLPFTSWTGIWKYKLKSLGKTRNGSETSRNRGSWNTPGTPSRHPEFPVIPPWRARPIPKRMAHEGFTIFFNKYLLPKLMSTVFESITHKIHLFWFLSCLVFFDFDILSLIKKKKYFFVLAFHIDFSGNLWFPKFIIALDISNGVFDFQNEIDMDLTHVTASLQWVVSDTQGQDTQTHIIAGRDREGVLSEEAVSTFIRTVAKTAKFKQKYLFQRRNYRTSRFSLKTH